MQVTSIGWWWDQWDARAHTTNVADTVHARHICIGLNINFDGKSCLIITFFRHGWLAGGPIELGEKNEAIKISSYRRTCASKLVSACNALVEHTNRDPMEPPASRRHHHHHLMRREPQIDCDLVALYWAQIEAHQSGVRRISLII